MKLTEYQEWVRAEWTRKPRAEDLAIMTLGLCGESGEVSEPIKKHIRGDGPVDKDALALELGDVIHYATAIANHFGIDMEYILDGNVSKLETRKKAKARLMAASKGNYA